MTAIVTRGNAADLHLPDETVDLIVTSPPYFGLRSYQDGGEHYAGQVGDEAAPTEYLDALIACTAEWMRVLKPGGSIFVNLGDKYSNGGRTSYDVTDINGARGGVRAKDGMAPKTLIGLPWRYAIRCIDELGLILRAEIVWAKPNGLPESVTDRVRRSHEQVFHFVKQPRYYSAVDEVREEHVRGPRPNEILGLPGRGINGGVVPGRSDYAQPGNKPAAFNPLGKLPGSVWEIPTAPLKVPASLGIDHFAAYPPELVRRIVLGWSPREVCTACGEGLRPVSERASMRRHNNGKHGPTGVNSDNTRNGNSPTSTLDIVPEYVITGYACACPEPGPAAQSEGERRAGGGRSSDRRPGLASRPQAETTPGVVLDPFGGTGTTALVASCYGRVGISVDLSADYCRLAQWRTTDPGERARVLKVEKPPVQVDGQLGMFEGMGA